MNKKLAIGISVVTIGLAGFILSLDRPAAKVSEETGSSGTLTLSESEFEFGTIRIGDGVVSKDIVVKNDGIQSVSIENVYTSCMCTVAELTVDGKTFGPFGMPGHARASMAGMEIPPGGEGTLKVVFDPAAHGPSGVGRADRTVYLVTNSASTPKVEVKFSALVTP